jgi:homospermidine synthase
MASWHELLGSAGTLPTEHAILDVDEITGGIDELGVLLYGHDRNAYWYGSRLSNDETRDLAPHQNATGLQVTSAVLAAMVWARENPDSGIVEADEVDYRRCLDVQTPYLGPVEGHFTDWTPLMGRSRLFTEDIDASDPWQFRNVLVH